MSHNIAKKCTLCGESFTADELIHNPDLKLMGMILVPDADKLAYYLYQHKIENCGTSMAVNVEVMAQFLTEAIPTDKLTLSDCCEGHCVNLKDMSLCSQECYYAPYRRFLFVMMKKKDQSMIDSRLEN